MSARTWTETDPQPDGVRAVVDPDGVTWALADHDGCGYLTWHQQLITHLGGGVVSSGSIGNDWADIFWSLPEGAELREATADEADTWIERWPAQPARSTP